MSIFRSDVHVYLDEKVGGCWEWDHDKVQSEGQVARIKLLAERTFLIKVIVPGLTRIYNKHYKPHNYMWYLCVDIVNYNKDPSKYSLGVEFKQRRSMDVSTNMTMDSTYTVYGTASASTWWEVNTGYPTIKK